MSNEEREFEIIQDDMLVASACGDDALNEIKHYAAQYEQDGPIKVYEVIRREIDLAAPAVANGAADERSAFEKAMNDARFFPAELDFTLTKSPSGKRDEYVNTHLESCWNGWQARAAIAASTQQAAPKALTKSQSHALATCVNGGAQMGWVSDDDARAILAAAVPNVLLVAALQRANQYLSGRAKITKQVTEFQACTSITDQIRAALASVPTAPEAI